jgi:hypothetical protein
MPIFAESAMMGVAHRGAMRGNIMNQAEVIGSSDDDQCDEFYPLVYGAGVTVARLNLISCNFPRRMV